MHASPGALLNEQQTLVKSVFRGRSFVTYFYVGDSYDDTKEIRYASAFGQSLNLYDVGPSPHFWNGEVRIHTLDETYVERQVHQDVPMNAPQSAQDVPMNAPQSAPLAPVDELDDDDAANYQDMMNAIEDIIADDSEKRDSAVVLASHFRRKLASEAQAKIEKMDSAVVLGNHFRRKLASEAQAKVKKVVALLAENLRKRIQREQKAKHDALVEEQRLQAIADKKKAEDEARQKQERKRQEDEEQRIILLAQQEKEMEQQEAQQREARERLKTEQAATEEKAKKAREELAKKQAQTEASAEETALRKALADGQRKLLEDQQKLQQDTLALQQQTAREKLANAQLKLQIQQERENLIEDKNLDKINLDMQKQRLQTQSAADLTLRQKHAADFDRLQQEHDTKSADLAMKVQALQLRQASLDERDRLQNLQQAQLDEQERLQKLQQVALDAAAAPADPLDGGAAAAAASAAAAADASAAALAGAAAEILRLKQALSGSPDGGAAADAAAAAAAAAAASIAALTAADQAEEILRLQREVNKKDRELRAERDKVHDALWDFANLEKEADGLYDRLGGRPAPAGPPVDPTQEFSYRKYHGGFDYGDWIAAMDALCLFRDTDRSYALFHMDWQTVLHENGLLLAKIAARAVPFGTWELSRAFFKANEGSCRLTPLWNNLYFQFGLITQRLTEENLRPWVTGERERLIGWCRTVCTFAQKRLYKDEADFIKRGGDDRRGYRAGYNSSHGPLRWFWYGDHELHVDIRFLDKIMSAYFSEFTVIDSSSMKEIYLDEARSLAGVMEIQGWTYEEATVISNDLHKEVQDAIDLRFPGASLDVTPRCRKALETISKWKWRVRDNDTHRAVYARLYEHARRAQTEDAPAAAMLWLQAVEHHRRYTLRQCPTGES